MPASAQSQTDPIVRAITAFKEAFGTDPEAVAIAPGRVNLIGDHTDYNRGLAMPMTIQSHAAVVIGPHVDHSIEVVAADLEERHAAVPDSNSFVAPAAPLWFAYPAGAALLAVQASPHSLNSTGLRIAIASSVPIGGGLSSSSAIEVATVTAIESLLKHSWDPIAKAKLCQMTEHRYAGTPSGLLDPLAILLGLPGGATLIDFNTLKHSGVPIPEQASFVLIDTGITHSNSDGRYADIRTRCTEAAHRLNVPSLSHASECDLVNHSGDDQTEDQSELNAELAHVLSENRRVREFAAALIREDLLHAGRLMNESHRSLSQRLGVSTPEIDSMVVAIHNADGVLGCRMTGGGFGGFLVALVETPRLDAILEEIRRIAGEFGGRLGDPATVQPDCVTHSFTLPTR